MYSRSYVGLVVAGGTVSSGGTVLNNSDLGMRCMSIVTMAGIQPCHDGPCDGSSKVLFPLLALNRNSMRDASCFKLKLLHHNNATKTQGLICLKKESV